MSLRRIPRTLAAIVRRDWLDSVRHRTGFIVQAGTMVAQLGGFYLFAHVIGPRYRPEGMAYYPYLLLGTAMFSFYVSGVSTFVSSLKEAQVAGTLEAVMNTSTPPILVIGLGAVSVFGAAALRMAFFVGAALAPMAASVHPNWTATCLVMAISVLVAVALGMLAAAAQVAAQRGEIVVWLFGIGGWLLTGMAFPTSGLPRVLQWVSELLPITYSISALRAALLGDSAWYRVVHPIVQLGTAAAILLPVSAAALAWVVQRARARGTLSVY